ncbi:MAG: hypothetical protein ACTSP7_02070, partial [Candidatus Heimdallarchaeota archaeon]
MNRKIRLFTLFSLLCLLTLPLSAIVQSNNLKRVRGLSSMSREKIMAKDLLENLLLNENEYVSNEVIAGDGFWGLKNGSIINYNPVCIFANDSYWESLTMYNSHNDYYFEASYNGTTLFDSTYEYSNYSDFWYDGYEWNVSSFFPNKCLNLSMSFYLYGDPSINHTNSIMIYFDILRLTPTINLNDFEIDFFHLPGSQDYGYQFFTPYGTNSYYHFAIFSDGYIQLKYGDLELYDNHDLTTTDIQDLLHELIDLGFFQLRNNYYPMSSAYDLYYSSYFDIKITSDFGNESRSIFEAYDFHL